MSKQLQVLLVYYSIADQQQHTFPRIFGRVARSMPVSRIQVFSGSDKALPAAWRGTHCDHTQYLALTQTNKHRVFSTDTDNHTHNTVYPEIKASDFYFFMGALPWRQFETSFYFKQEFEVLYCLNPGFYCRKYSICTDTDDHTS